MSKTVTTEEFLADLFDSAQEGLSESISQDEYARRRREFVFHMSDAKPDLEKLVGLLNHPEDFQEPKTTTALMAILYHIIPHLKAAGRLLLDEIPDPFAE